MSDTPAPIAPTPQAELEVALALTDDHIERFYFNGFSIGASPSDCSLLFKVQNKAVAFANLPYPVAKELGMAIIDQIGKMEVLLGSKILTTKEIAEAHAKMPKA